MQLARKKPRVLVIGLGSYFRKLRKVIHKHFEVVQLVDCEPCEKLRLMPNERKIFRQFPKTLNGLTVGDSVDCLMLLSPPAFHVSHIESVAAFQKPVFVEKPVATTSVEIAYLERAVAHNPRLYCSDFYPDVRAAPLLTWIDPNLHSSLRSELQLANGDQSLWTSGLTSFGTILRVEGKLLESSGAARGFEGREWLWEPSQGGVLRDLMYHYVTLSSYIFNEDLIPARVVLQTWEKGGERLPWRPDIGLAETYALVEGQLRTGIPFCFEVAKYWKGSTQRQFTLYCSAGTATMVFKNPNVLILESGEAKCEIILKGSYYEHMVRQFLNFVRSGVTIPHGLDHAIRAVRVIDDFKQSILSS